MKLFILPVLFSLFIFGVSSHITCHHDKLEYSLNVLKDPGHAKRSRSLKTAQYNNIRIYADYTYLSSNIDSSTKKYIKSDLLPTAINYYQQALLVIRSPKPLIAAESTTCDLPTPSIFLKTGVKADIAIIVETCNEQSNYIAIAKACSLSEPYNRPVFGDIIFNLNYVRIGDDIQREMNLIATLHEMAHIFGISKGLYEFYYDIQTNHVRQNHLKTKTINGIESYLIDVEPLTSKLRDYFDCPTIEGVLLENEGLSASAYSHLEKRVFDQEIMTANAGKESRISEFMLAFLEGTGWYKINYSLAEPMFWGKGKGCDFYYGPCVTTDPVKPRFEEFCPELEELGCTLARRHGAVCGSCVQKTSSDMAWQFNYWGNWSYVADDFADNCPYFYLDSSRDCEDPSHQGDSLNEEIYGIGSKCFTGSIAEDGQDLPEKARYCFQASCEQEGDSSFILKIKLRSTNVTCTGAGPIDVPGYTGQINCPDPNVYCSTYGANYCGRGCTGRGQCVNNQCVCKDGWGGNDCGKRVYKEGCDRCKNSSVCYGDNCIALTEEENHALFEEDTAETLRKGGKFAHRFKAFKWLLCLFPLFIFLI